MNINEKSESGLEGQLLYLLKEHFNANFSMDMHTYENANMFHIIATTNFTKRTERIQGLYVNANWTFLDCLSHLSTSCTCISDKEIRFHNLRRIPKQSSACIFRCVPVVSLQSFPVVCPKSIGAGSWRDRVESLAGIDREERGVISMNETTFSDQKQTLDDLHPNDHYNSSFYILDSNEVRFSSRLHIKVLENMWSLGASSIGHSKSVSASPSALAVHIRPMASWLRFHSRSHPNKLHCDVDKTRCGRRNLNPRRAAEKQFEEISRCCVSDAHAFDFNSTNFHILRLPKDMRISSSDRGWGKSSGKSQSINRRLWGSLRHLSERSSLENLWSIADIFDF